MTVYSRANYARRCCDCRDLIEADARGQIVADRLLCDTCTTDIEKAEAGL